MRARTLAAVTLSSLPLLAFACGSDPSPGPVTPVASAQPSSAPSPSVVAVASVAPSASTSELPTPTVGIDEAAMDKSVDPCDDFYAYACNGWLKATPIPDDRSKWVRSFSVIDERNIGKLHDLLERAAAGTLAPADAVTKKVGDAYAACMDEATVEKTGATPLTEPLAIIDGIKDEATLRLALQKLYAMGFTPLFGVGSGQDFADATQVIGQLEQGGLGLPDRDNYSKQDGKSRELRKKYEKHVEAMLVLSGMSAAAAKKGAATVVAIETDLARASMSRVDKREPKKVYHRMSVADVDALAPKLAFAQLASSLGIAATAPINVAEPEFFKNLSARLHQTSLADWRVMLRWHVVHEMAPALSSKFVDEDFAFMRKTVQGQPTIEPRWKRCVHAVDQEIGEGLAQPFVRDAFDPESKAAMLSLVDDVEKAMDKDLAALPWMDDATRAKAIEKLHKTSNMIGYPDAWRNYDALTLRRDGYGANVMAASAFELRRQLAQIGKPVDRGEWQMTPPTVNAYNNGELNQMVFPAGILQPPFFDKHASIAMNYGAIGMVIGHELTHSFDDEGRKFDGDGNLRDWWTPSVGTEFDHRASCVVKEFDGFEVLPAEPAHDGKPATEAVHLKGALTLGENIADLGGIKIAFAAMHLAKERAGAGWKTIGPYTDDQQFFLSFAQGWCGNTRPEEARRRAMVDTHSSSRFRVDGPLSNLSEFADAFQCKAGSKMVRKPEDRCQVW